MKRVKVLLLALAAVGVAACAVVPSAFASGPTILFLSSEPGPTVLLKTKTDNPNNGILGQLQSGLATIESKGLLFDTTLEQTANGVAGTYSVLFLESKLATGTKEPCNTPRDAAGEILLGSNSALLVYDALGSGTALGVAARLNVAKFEILCEKEKLKIKIEGSVLSLIKEINHEYEPNKEEIESTTRCSGTFGVPSEKKFWNTAGREEEVALKVTTGGRTEEGCEQTERARGTTPVLLSANTMIEVMG